MSIQLPDLTTPHSKRRTQKVTKSEVEDLICVMKRMAWLRKKCEREKRDLNGRSISYSSASVRTEPQSSWMIFNHEVSMINENYRSMKKNGNS